MPGHKVPVRPILTELSRDVNKSEALTENFLQQTAQSIKASLQKYLERELVDQRITSRDDYSMEDRSCQYPIAGFLGNSSRIGRTCALFVMPIREESGQECGL